MPKLTPYVLGLASVLLLGAGCATTELEVTGGNEAPEAISFADAKTSFMDSTGKYKAFEFTQTGGDCLEKGLAPVFSYHKDDDLGYFVTSAADGSFKDDNVMATAHYMTFNEVEIDGQQATCAVTTTFGKNEGEVKCNTTDSDTVAPICAGQLTTAVLPI